MTNFWRNALTIATVSMTLGVVAAFADEVLTADVPVAFTVNGKAMPAGSYRIHQPSERVFVIQAEEGKNSAAVLAALSLNSKNQSPRLVLQNLGAGYTLTQVWISAPHGFGRVLSAAERSYLEENGPGATALVTVKAMK